MCHAVPLAIVLLGIIFFLTCLRSLRPASPNAMLLVALHEVGGAEPAQERTPPRPAKARRVPLATRRSAEA